MPGTMSPRTAGVSPALVYCGECGSRGVSMGGEAGAAPGNAGVSPALVYCGEVWVPGRVDGRRGWRCAWDRGRLAGTCVLRGGAGAGACRWAARLALRLGPPASRRHLCTAGRCGSRGVSIGGEAGAAPGTAPVPPALVYCGEVREPGRVDRRRGWRCAWDRRRLAGTRYRLESNSQEARKVTGVFVVGGTTWHLSYKPVRGRRAQDCPGLSLFCLRPGLRPPSPDSNP